MSTAAEIARRKAQVKTLLEAAFTRGPSLAEKRAVMASIINPRKYIQHSAVVPDGFEGLMGLVAQFDHNFQSYAVAVKRIIAEDDLVVAHCHYTFGPSDPRGKAIVEIFRFEDGAIVEHWDVIQDVPAQMANSNGMF